MVAGLSFPERLREFLASRRFLWLITILFGVLVILYLLFVTFLFNPFEDPLPDTAAVVPREVDYFLRWKGAGRRFGHFPVPVAWEEFERTHVHERLSDAGRLQAWDEELGVSKAVQSIADLADNLPPGMDLADDLLREVALAGRGTPSLDANFDGVLLLRVSFKVKAGVSLLDLGFVRDKLPDSLGVEDIGGGRYRLPQFGPFGFQDAFLARVRDVLLLASRKEWLDFARDLELRSGEGSLAQASVFHDNVEAYLAPGDQPLEIFLRRSPLRSLFGSWPRPGPGSYWEKLIQSFFSTDLLQRLAGYWLPGERFEGRFSADVDMSTAKPSQRAWGESHAISVNDLRDFAGMVPRDCFLYGALSGDVSRDLSEAYAAVDEDLRRIVDENVIGTGKYQGMPDLLSRFGKAFGPGLYFALRRNDYPPDPVRDTQHDDAPVPVFVVMSKLRDQGAYQELEDFFIGNAFRFLDRDQKSQWEEVPVLGGTKAKSFTSLAIPGTGEILFMEVPARRLVLLSNSYKFAEQVLRTTFLDDHDPEAAKQKLSQRSGFEHALGRLGSGAKLFLYFDPSESKPWTDELALEAARASFREEMDPLFQEWRPEEERKQRDFLFPGVAQLDPAQQAQLQQAVDDALLKRSDSRWKERQPALAEAFRLDLLPAQLFDWLVAAVDLGRRKARVLIAGELVLD